jgi:hypothetical protein
MRQSWVAAVALLTACGTTSGTVSCSPCAGPGYAMTGVPDVLRHAVVTVCVGHQPCGTTRVREPMSTGGLQYAELPSGGTWEHYDGTRVRLSVRAREGRWRGSGTFVYTPDDGATCSCPGLAAEVAMSNVSPRG